LKNINDIKKFYSKNNKFFSFQSNIALDTLNNSVLKTLSPNILILLGNNKDNYLDYLRNKHGHNFVLINSFDLLEVYKDDSVIPQSKQLEYRCNLLKKVIYNGDCVD